MYEKLISYRMHLYVRHRASYIHVWMLCHHSIKLLRGRTSRRPSRHDIDSVQLQVFSKHLQSTTTTTPFETDEAMDDIDAIYTTTTTTHAHGLV